MTDSTNEKAIKLSAAKKKAFLEKRLQRRAKSETTTLIPRRAQHSPAPLTYAQEGVWYAEQLQPGNPTYNMPFAWRLYGPLDVAALERSLSAVIQRHESLRTHIELIDGQPMQVITNAVNLSMQITNLQHLSTVEQKNTALTLLDAEVHRPFDLRQAPLLRSILLQLAPTDHFFSSISTTSSAMAGL